MLSADEIISGKQDEENFISQLKEIHNNTPIAIIIEYTYRIAVSL